MQKSLFWTKLIFVLYLVTCHSIGLTSQDSLFTQANDYYQKNQYDQSISLYQQLIRDQDMRSADLYYNLGSAYLKKNDIANALLYLEKAIKINPHNNDYLTNLGLANELQQDDFGLIQDFFIIRWAHKVAQWFTSTSWAIMTIILFITTCVLFLVWLFHTAYRIKKIVFWGGVVGLTLTLLSVIFGAVRQNLELNNPYAIIMSQEETLKMAPDEDSKEVVVIHAGLKVKVLDELGLWSKIELSNKEVGWLLSDNLEGI